MSEFFYQPMPSDFICEAHGAPATGFLAHSDGSQAFFCENCIPKDPDLLQDCHPINKFPLFKALKYDQKLIRDRKRGYLNASKFLEEVYQRKIEVHERSKALIEHLSISYMTCLNQGLTTFQSVFDGLKEEIETVYAQPQYNITNLGDALLKQDGQKAKTWAEAFFCVPEESVLYAVSKKCEPLLWKTNQVAAKELYKAIYEKLSGEHKSEVLPKPSDTLYDPDAPELALHLPRQELYEGDYNDLHEKHGTGKFIYRTGDVYLGEWRHGKRHGIGTHTFSNKNEYSGTWENDEMRGFGSYHWKNGFSYEGKFTSNVPESPYSLWKYSYKGASCALILILVLFFFLASTNIYHICFSHLVIHGVQYQAYSDGFYHGEFRGGKRHGIGTFLWPSGGVYVGQWYQDLKQGSGLLLDQDKNWYYGEFKNDYFYTGKTGLNLPSGDMYIGESMYGERKGTGIYLTVNGTIYSGVWGNNIETGVGISVEKDHVFVGNFTAKKGISVISYPNGNQYIGESDGNSRRGKGLFRWENGGFYYGFWSQNLQNGWGVHFSQRNWLIGTFNNNKIQSGLGAVQYENGDLYQGHFLNNQRSGSGVYFFNDSSIYFGHWEADNMTGEGIKTEANGNAQSGLFSNGTLVSGKAVISTDAETYIGDFSFGERDGFGTVIGDVVYVGQWLHHKPHGQGLRSYGNGDFQNGRFSYDEFITGSALFSYPNTEKYFGTVTDRQRQGRGTYIWGQETMYSGDWVNGQMHGNGLFSDTGNSSYIGQFQNNTFLSGLGLVTFSNGDMHFGRYSEGQISGNGVRIWTNESAYSGLWASGTMHGSGTLIKLNGDFRRGTFLSNAFVEGKTFLMYENKDIYYGNFSDQAICWGVYIAENGSAYMGEWEHGLRTGQGVYIQDAVSYMSGRFLNNSFQSGSAVLSYADESLYIGEVENGLSHGNGTYIWSNSTIYTGEWRSGRISGPGFLGHSSLDFSIGIFDGEVLKTGKSLVTYENGDKFYGTMNNNLRTGCGVYLWENGTIYSGNWSRDEMVGVAFVVTMEDGGCYGRMEEGPFERNGAEMIDFSAVAVLFQMFLFVVEFS